jgi:putative Mg2+ transporter-C (MgtC) family protein
MTAAFLTDWIGALQTVTWPQMTVRLLAALIGGALIGLDREWRHKPAGLRTHMLVALAAATFCIIAGEIAVATQAQGGNPDPVRIIEAVTAGAAFLAAGTILHGGRGGDGRRRVHGITTGTSIWLSAAIGTACGAGLYPLAVLAVLLSLLVLTVMVLLEGRRDPPEPDRD